MNESAYGTEKLQNFKVEQSSLNRLEINNLLNFCKTFEMRFSEELKDLIEYKMEIVERTTFYVQKAAIREFTANMLFVTTTRCILRFVEMRKQL